MKGNATPYQVAAFKDEREKINCTNAITGRFDMIWIDIDTEKAFELLINKTDYVGCGCYIQSMDHFINLERKAKAAAKMLDLGAMTGFTYLDKPIAVKGWPEPPILFPKRTRK